MSFPSASPFLQDVRASPRWLCRAKPAETRNRAEQFAVPVSSKRRRTNFWILGGRAEYHPGEIQKEQKIRPRQATRRKAISAHRQQEYPVPPQEVGRNNDKLRSTEW